MKVPDKVRNFLRSGSAFFFTCSEGVINIVKIDNEEEELKVENVTIDDWINYLDKYEKNKPYDIMFIETGDNERVVGVIGKPKNSSRILETIITKAVAEIGIELGEKKKVSSMLNEPSILRVAPLTILRFLTIQRSLIKEQGREMVLSSKINKVDDKMMTLRSESKQLIFKARGSAINIVQTLQRNFFEFFKGSKGSLVRT